MRRLVFCSFALAAALLVCRSSSAVLYSQDFDVDDTANWTVNNNGLGTNKANFFFDYSTAGIPSAPNSTGGTTLGLKIGANLNSATAPTVTSQIPGISVSPTGQSFTGSYSMRFDWWSNYIGPLNVGATGSTMLSNYGIMTSGTTANWPGTADGVWFAATGDGQSSSDYRIYSPEKPTSYIVSASPPDNHATYAAGSTNQTAALYMSTFPAGAVAPGSQNGADGTQTSSTPAGAAGFRWHDVLITKNGNIVTWHVNGVLLATLDTSFFSTGGNNILFGHSDTNNTTNTNATLLDKWQFTLIDNVVVEAIPEPTAFLFGGIVCSVLGAAMVWRRQRAAA